MHPHRIGRPRLLESGGSHLLRGSGHWRSGRSRCVRTRVPTCRKRTGNDRPAQRAGSLVPVVAPPGRHDRSMSDTRSSRDPEPAPETEPRRVVPPTPAPRDAGAAPEPLRLPPLLPRRQTPWLIVEVDGSPSAHHGLVWALREAARREATVVAVTVLDAPAGDPLDGLRPGPGPGPARRARPPGGPGPAGDRRDRRPRPHPHGRAGPAGLRGPHRRHPRRGPRRRRPAGQDHAPPGRAPAARPTTGARRLTGRPRRRSVERRDAADRFRRPAGTPTVGP